MTTQRRPQDGGPGFTLIELLIVIGIIGFIAASVLVAVDPVKRIQDARDARRYSESNALLNAILNKQVDERTVYPATETAPIITSTTNSQVIVTSDSGVDCTAVGTRPGCNQVMDTTAAKNCVANISETINGPGNISGSSTTITGFLGTQFLTQANVGDTLIAAGQTFIIASIISNSSLTVTVAPAPILTNAAYTLIRPNPLIPNYIASAPIDPRGAGTTYCGTGSGCATLGSIALGATNTGYYIHRSAGNRIEIGACKGEQTDPIFVKR